MGQYPTCEGKTSIKIHFFVGTRALDHFWSGPNVFGIFYMKSYDDEIRCVGTLSDLEYDSPNLILNFAQGPFFGRGFPFTDCTKRP